jgi:hypothetical protein
MARRVKLQTLAVHRSNSSHLSVLELSWARRPCCMEVAETDSLQKRYSLYVCIPHNGTAFGILDDTLAMLKHDNVPWVYCIGLCLR